MQSLITTVHVDIGIYTYVQYINLKKYPNNRPNIFFFVDEAFLWSSDLPYASVVNASMGRKTL